MIPKTEIVYSMCYNRVLSPGFNKNDYFELKKNCKNFEALYKKYIFRILDLMENGHSKIWKKKYIPIYIVKEVYSSFSDPLTIQFNKNEKIMLVALVHELFHNNSFEGKKFDNPSDAHEYMQPIVDKIVRDLGLDLENELHSFNWTTMRLARENSK